MTLPEHVLVTGGAGFIGSHIVDELISMGVGVTVLDNLDPAAHAARPDYLNPMASYVWGDCRNRSDWLTALRGVDAVCHQAGKVGLGVDFGDVDAYVAHNDAGWAEGLRALHELSSGARASARPSVGSGVVRRIVLASSMVVYGEGRYRCESHGVVRPGPRRITDLQERRFEPPCPDCGRPLTSEEIPEDAPLDPRNVYAATKLHQEHLLASFVREHQRSAFALRYHNVYGPRMPRGTPYAGVASIFRSALADGRAPQVTEDGNQMRNFVHVRDVAHANVLALAIDDDCGVDSGGAPGAGLVCLNVASTEPRSVGDMARSLARAFDPSGDRPELAPLITGAYRAGDVRHVFASVDRIRSVLGFTSSVGFDEGMHEFATARLRDPVPSVP